MMRINPTLPRRLALLAGSAQLALLFRAIGRSSRIDDVFIDPHLE
jgi:hypothetical protein